MSIKAKNKFHNIMCEFLSVTILCIMIISLFFYPAVFQGKIIYQEDPGGTDTFDLHVARRYLAVQCIKQYGEFPLWEPKIACGAPLFAESEIGLFYPSFIFFFLNNLTLATNLTVFSALLIAMLGSYAWSRSLGLEQLASGVAAISFGLGEVFLLRTGALNIIHVIAWLPFSLSVIHLMAQHSQKRYWCLLVSIWTLQLLAGHFQMFAICLFLCMLYCIYDTFFVCQKQFRFRFITCTFLALCYAAALGSIQLLPTYEFTRQSERVHIPLELAEIQMSSPKWENIIKLVSP